MILIKNVYAFILYVWDSGLQCNTNVWYNLGSIQLLEYLAIKYTQSNLRNQIIFSCKIDIFLIPLNISHWKLQAQIRLFIFASFRSIYISIDFGDRNIIYHSVIDVLPYMSNISMLFTVVTSFRSFLFHLRCIMLPLNRPPQH
jgi:hypothetical protein